MAEQPAAPPVTPNLRLQQAAVTRAVDFKLFYSNYFRLRLGPGECAITFATMTDVPSGMVPGAIPGTAVPQLMTLVQEDIGVAVSWPVLKALSKQLNEMVQAIESETGKIREIRTTLTAEQSIENFRKVLRLILPPE